MKLFITITARIVTKNYSALPLLRSYRNGTSCLLLFHEDLFVLQQYGFDGLNLNRFVSIRKHERGHVMTDFTLEAHVLQVHRTHLWRSAQKGRAKDDAEVTDGHVIDLLHATNPVREQSISKVGVGTSCCQIYLSR